MRGNPLKTIASLAITALLGYWHSMHIWPFTSIFNEGCLALICVLLIALIWKWNKA